MPGPSEWLIIAIVAIVVIFGAKKIPELAQSLGKGIREFRKAARDIQEEVTDEVKKVEEKSSSTKTESKS